MRINQLADHEIAAIYFPCYPLKACAGKIIKKIGNSKFTYTIPEKFQNSHSSALVDVYIKDNDMTQVYVFEPNTLKSLFTMTLDLTVDILPETRTKAEKQFASEMQDLRDNLIREIEQDTEDSKHLYGGDDDIRMLNEMIAPKEEVYGAELTAVLQLSNEDSDSEVHKGQRSHRGQRRGKK